MSYTGPCQCVCVGEEGWAGEKEMLEVEAGQAASRKGFALCSAGTVKSGQIIDYFSGL